MSVYSEKVVLLVTYHLKGPAAHYTPLYDLLKAQSAWSHYLPTTWLVSTEKTPRELAELIKPLTQDGDFFITVRITDEYWGWLPKEAWDWLKANMPTKQLTL